ncbi:MAG TPA: hypothetical protein VI423_00860 [Paenisporosarcina sp.]|nr:hypothetical protein [Paenisporosarcina sp.]
MLFDPNVKSSGVVLSPGYMACSAIPNVTNTSVNSIASHFYLFKPAASTRRVEIVRIHITFAGGTGGSYKLSANYITAENAVPGGTVTPTLAKDRGDPSSDLITCSAATGAPTRITGDLLTWGVDGSDYGQIVWEASPWEKPFILRPNLAEGIEIKSSVLTTILTAPTVAVSIDWMEV